ncbi:DUF2249 domain-containing protein [Psychrobacillus sp. INOP01]|uniref:DUF2249 domain-containing protein n=1 Tax=Psychrobacillus sp. INOP01 TaxID=2829187 RepID=UPI001BA4C6F9|nr:DUF2249 domain-containing protein [Psychrobacillus sp. INOP01]QUG42894.1 DUF2249 domain-containing protein [Psychrobacillus sp. INOP01]
MNTQTIVELDVREDLLLKKEPFDKIMGAVKQLKPGQIFVLHAPFNPIPLHKLLGSKGFIYEVIKLEKKHWQVTYIQKGLKDSDS